jgi:hypothetical protein
VSNPCQHILDVSFAVNNGDDFQRLRSAIYDHVLIYAEEQHAPTCKVATFVSFARKVAQASERVNQFILNSVSYRQAGLFEKVSPNFSKIIFGFRGNPISLHLLARPLR